MILRREDVEFLVDSLARECREEEDSDLRAEMKTLFLGLQASLDLWSNQALWELRPLIIRDNP